MIKKKHEFISDITSMDFIFLRTITKSDDCETFYAITLDNQEFYGDEASIKYETKWENQN